MNSLPAGPELDAIVGRCLNPTATRAWGDVPTTPYSTSFAACETALEWLRQNGGVIVTASVDLYWAGPREASGCYAPQTLQHAVALAVVAVGVAKGIVDEKGNLR